jgi:hypothetical protein
MSLARHPDPVIVARYLRDGLRHAHRRGQWTLAVADALAAARMLYGAGEVANVARIVGGCVARGFRGGRSGESATGLARRIRDEHGSDIDADLEIGAVMSARALCELAIERLDAFLVASDV